MHNLYAIFVKFHGICKLFAVNLVNEFGNVPRCGVVPKFSDLEVVALSMTGETESIDSENLLFSKLSEYKEKLLNLISRCQFNDLTKASVHDINYLNDIKYLYQDCSIFGDRGYIGKEIQLDLFETANIKIECPYRLKQKKWKPIFVPLAKARKRIETMFSQLCDPFMLIKNYAKGTKGLFARIIGKVSALTIFQYVNNINNKTIGQIKYALI